MLRGAEQEVAKSNVAICYTAIPNQHYTIFYLAAG
jgi:hypothetical protein